MSTPNSHDPAHGLTARNLGAGSQPVYTGEGDQIVLANGGTFLHVENYHAKSTEELSPASVIKWLGSQSSPLHINSLAYHRMLLEERVAGTGQWVLESPQFREWKLESSESRRLLWMHGILGSGKSMLASSIIENLEKEIGPKDNVACLYVYFQDDEEKQPTFTEVLAYLLRQLVQQRKYVPIVEDLLAKYREYHCHGQEGGPTAKEYLGLFSAQAAAFQRVYLVIDALDCCRDCPSEKTQRSILDAISDIPPSVKILVTTRSGSHVGKQLEVGEECELEVEARPADIETYVESHIQHDPNLQRMIQEGGGSTYQKMVVHNICKASKGIFLLTTLHVNWLSKQRSFGDFKIALSKPPENMSLAFDSAIQRIEKQERQDRELAKHVLTWLLYAASPLTASELLHSFAILFTARASNREFDRPEDDLTLVCGGLAAMDPKTRIVRIVHDSVQEYVEANGLVLQNPQAEIARHCLKYLLCDDFAEPVSTKEDLEQRLRDYPLLKYAANHWFSHLRLAEKDGAEVVEKLAMDLLRDQAKLTSWFQVVAENSSQRITGLHAAVYLDLPTWAENLIKEGVDVNATCHDGQTALHWAATVKQVSCVKTLLLHSALRDVKDMNGNTPLHKAVMSQQEMVHQPKSNLKSVVRELVAGSGADQINVRNKRGWTPFVWALQNGPFWVVQILAEHQTETSVEGHDGCWSPLREVMKSMPWSPGKANVVELLLRGGADVSEAASDGWHPLIDAAQNGEASIIRLLVKYNAAVDVEDEGGRTPLRWAITYGHAHTSQLLIQCGADVNRKCKDGLTALIEAVRGRRNDIAWLLLENKAVPDLVDEGGATPLHYAVVDRNASLVWLLVSKNADVNIRDGAGMSVLDVAVLGGDFSIVWLLLHHGARASDPDLGCSGRLTTLHYAAKHGHEKIARLLVSNQAEIDAKDKDGLTALIYATRQDDKVMMESLLEQGASPDVQDTVGCTALHHAIKMGNRMRAVVVLLKERANADLKNDDQKTPLMLAAEGGQFLEVLALLEHGASAGIKDANGKTARALAEAKGHEDVLTIMSGAGVTT